MKYFIYTLLFFSSFNAFANDDFDYKNVLKKASYENCRIVLINGKLKTYNCKAEDKKKDVIREVDYEIKRTVNRKIDKALKKAFKW